VSRAVQYRPARPADLDACTHIWRRGIDDYQGRLNQPPIGMDHGTLRSLFAHLLSTDPDRFWVATHAPDTPLAYGEALDEEGRWRVGFGSATLRDGIWFLGMLFVLPGMQATGIGRALLDRTLAGDGRAGAPVVRGTCTDAAQPISNALYARHGLIPRVPIWRLTGELRRPSLLPSLPKGYGASPFSAELGAGPEAAARLRDAIGQLDRATLGAAHPADHEMLRRDGREGWLVRDDRGGPVAYGYASGTGRLGPLAALDPALVGPLLGMLSRTIRTHDDRTIWLPTTCDGALSALLAAGLRLDGFPGLLCWSRPEHPFDRYVPISLALL
jgi:GNAT superfamily N-acetyltransferase